MTVPVQNPIISYVGNGITTLFAFPFEILQSEDIKVLLNGILQAIGSQISVNGIGAANGGSVVFSIVPAIGDKIIIYRDISIERDTDYQDNGDLLAVTVNADFDRIWMALQDIDGISGRAIRYPVTEFATDGTLPVALDRASKLLGFDELGGQTLIPIPASVGAGDLKNEAWTAGTDYTAGVSTFVTLSRAYGSKANLGTIVMAGIAQDPNTYSLTNGGLTLQFDSVIPASVNRIWGVGGTTLSLNTPAFQSVTDDSISPASNIWHRINDTITVRDRQFGAKGDGVADDSAAFHAALNFAVSQNKRLIIPSGEYIISAPQIAQFSNATGGLNSQGRRPRIEGEGSEDTLLFYTGTSASPVLSVIGAGDFVDLVTIKGFRINRPFTSPAGIGLLVQKTIHGEIEDVAGCGFNTGLLLTDVNALKLCKVFLSGNNFGFFAQQGDGGTTAPNLIEWDSCGFDSNIKSAGTSLLGTVVAFRNCSFEGNGDGTSPTLTLTYNGGTGCAASSFYNNYFEGNWGPSDIHQTLVNPMPHGNMVVEGNVFDKVDATKFVTNHIFVDAGSLAANSNPFNMQIRGNGFFNGGLAPHNAAIVQAPGGSGYFGFRSNDMLNDNTYSFPLTEGPAIAQSSLIDGEAVCQISSAGILSNNFGVTACAKTGTGQYTLTVPQLTSAAALPTVTPNTTGIAQATAAVTGATQVIVQTASGAGVAADVATTVRIKML